MAGRSISQTRVPGRYIANAATGSMGVSFSTALVNGLTEAYGRIPKLAQALASTLEADLLQSRRLEANKALAEGAAKAVVSAYEQRSPIRHSGSYRGDRPGTKNYTRARYTGALGAALSNISAMTEGTTRSRIAFVNTERLGEEAPHWARLNFGAGGSHGKNPKAYQVTMVGPRGGSYQVAVLQFPDLHREAMKFPKGSWIEGESGDEFYPARGAASKEFKNVNAQATQYLDAGLSYISKNAGNAYVKMLSDAIRNPRTSRAVTKQFGQTIKPSEFRRGGISFRGGRVPRT